MRKLYYIIILSLLFVSCEDVIQVDVPNAPPRLVIDASINWFKGTSGNEQLIKLTLSAPYFDDDVPPANGAVVTVTNEDNTVFDFLEIDNTGTYANSNFAPVIDGSYTLRIRYNNETYTAIETLKSVSSVDFIEQKDDGGFSGEEIEIKAFYTDPVDEENFYFYQFKTDADTASEVYDDEFTNGNQIFAFYSEEDLEVGDELTIVNYGISNRFYEFMFILLQQSGDDSGGPFETQPATVRGNCVNETNPDNFPFGYFRLSQADTISYTIQ